MVAKIPLMVSGCLSRPEKQQYATGAVFNPNSTSCQWVPDHELDCNPRHATAAQQLLCTVTVSAYTYENAETTLWHFLLAVKDLAAMSDTALCCCSAPGAAVLPVSLQHAATHRVPICADHSRQPQCRDCVGHSPEHPRCSHMARLWLPVRAHDA